MKKSIPFFSACSLFVLLSLCSFVGDEAFTASNEKMTLSTTVFASDWSEVHWSNDYATYGQEVKAAPQLNASTLENALILRFIRWEATGTYFALPLALSDDAMITMMLQPGEIELYYYAEKPLDAPAIQAQYIIISPEEHLLEQYTNTKQVIEQQLKEAGIDIQNYEAVADFLNI